MPAPVAVNRRRLDVSCDGGARNGEAHSGPAGGDGAGRGEKEGEDEEEKTSLDVTGVLSASDEAAAGLVEGVGRVAIAEEGTSGRGDGDGDDWGNFEGA